MRKYFFSCIVFLCALTQAICGPDSLQVRNPAVKKDSAFINWLTKKRSFVLGPQLDRSPETGLLTGIYYLQLFKFRHDSLTRTSNIENTLSYTLKKQVIVEINNTLLFGGEKFILRGTNVYRKFSEDFFGIGNATPDSFKEQIDFDQYQFWQRLTGVINARNFFGFQYQYYRITNLKFNRGLSSDTTKITGAQGSITSGLGLVYLYDSRDNVINSYKGLYVDISNFWHRRSLGGQFNFNNVTVDARKFFELWPAHIFALQAVMNFNNGDVPFRQLAQVGGDVMMRGYYQGRFRDNDMMAMQAEYRFPVWKFLGMGFFGSAGEVANAPRSFNSSDIHYTYGFLMRVTFIKHERVNGGMDVGFGKHTTGLYFGIGESF